MQVQAAVIQVDGPHRRNAVVHQPGLAVQKARRVAEDLDPALQKRREVAAGQLEGDLLVRDAGGVDAHVHPPLGRQGKRGLDLVVQDQVGRGDKQAVPRLVDQFQIGILRDALPVHRAVGVGLHQAVGGKGRGAVGLRAEMLKLAVGGAVGVPELQEHDGKAPGRVAPQPDAGVPPVAEPLQLVDILVGQVGPAGKGGVAVNDHDLAVVAVVHDQVNHRHKGVEGQAVDALLLQLAPVADGQHADAAHIVVDDPHVHALGRLALEDLVDLVPHFAQADDEILDKNKMLGAFQRGQHVGKHILAQGIVFHLGVGKYRIRAPAAQVTGGQRAAGVLAGQLLLRGGVLAQQRVDAHAGVFQPAAQPERRALVAPQQVQDAALHRHDHKQRHPADLELRQNIIQADQQQAHDNAEPDADAVDPGGILGQAQEQKRHPGDLAGQQQAGDDKPAEHRAVQPFGKQSDLTQGKLL